LIIHVWRKQEELEHVSSPNLAQPITKVVIEEFLDGIELSCFVLPTVKVTKYFQQRKDYKRIGEGDTGLNTGGMGAVSPVPYVDAVLMDKIETRIVKPTIEGLQDGIPYKGFCVGLINVNNRPVLNITSEWEILKQKWLFKIKQSYLELFLAVANERLDKLPLKLMREVQQRLWWCQADTLKVWKGIFWTRKITDSIVFMQVRNRTGLLSVTEEEFSHNLL
jgi:phosphoribosylamine--glycine ligase